MTEKEKDEKGYMFGVPNTVRHLFDTFPIRNVQDLFSSGNLGLLQSTKMPLGFSISEADDAITIKVDVPGIPGSNLDVECDDDGVTVSGSFDSENSDKEGQQQFFGRMRGSFRQVFPLPVQFFETAATRAVVKDGVLTLVIPKVRPKEKVKVEIKSD